MYRVDLPEEPVLRQRLGGTVHGWTPSLDRCLEAGQAFAWLIGARMGEGELLWSEPKLFRTAATLSRAEFERALAVVRDYLAQGAAGAAVSGAASGAGTSAAATAGGPAAAAAGPRSRALGTADTSGLVVQEAAVTGIAFGIHGISQSTGDGSVGVAGESTAASGDTAGVAGEVASAAGSAGVFDNTAGGDVLRGLNNGTQVFEVAGTGQVTATGFTGDGSALTGVTADDSDTLDGIDSTAFLQKTELDTEAELEAQIGAPNVIVSTEIDSEAKLEALLADVADVLTDNDAVDADTLDGLDSTAFLTAVPSHSDGNGNTAVGLDALTSITTGSQNSAFGYQALTLNSSGSSNVAVGYEALEGNTTGVDNIGIGTYALAGNSTGDNNVALGSEALFVNADGADNVAIGRQALTANSSGTENVAVGSQALSANTGSRNVAIGDGAGTNATTGDDNVFIANEGVAAESDKIRIGVQGTQTATYVAGIHGTALAGSSVVVTAAGQLGVAAGASGDADTLDGIDSTAFLQKTELDTEAELEAQIGAPNVIVSTEIDSEAKLEGLLADVADVLTDNDSVDADSVDGLHAAAFVLKAGDTMTGTLTLTPGAGQALVANDDVNLASGNLLKGGTLFLHDDGTDNTAIGSSALSSVTTGYENLAAGSSALAANTTGYGNTAAGHEALEDNVAGAQNTAVGRQALNKNTGSFNTAVGAVALFNNTTGSSNTAVGRNALVSNTMGTLNTALGHGALGSNTTADGNTAVGRQALTTNSTGNLNVAVGRDALEDNDTGSGNTATGSNALQNNTTGQGNVATGHFALRDNTAGQHNTATGGFSLAANTGSRNVALGYRAGYDATTGDDNVFIGNEGVAADAAKIRVGVQGTQTATYVAGIHGTALAGSNVVVTAAGQLGVAAGASGDADTLDGIDSAAFLQKTELDTEGELEAQIGGANVIVATEIDAEAKLEALLGDVNDVLTDNDSVDADTLDGVDSTGFVLEAGDTMTGTLTLSPGAGNALEANADVNLANGNLRKGGALFVHDNGDRNNAFGYQALASVTGQENTAVGHEAMRYATSGNSNVAVGMYALRVNAGGIVNTAVGRAAMYSNTTGSNNIAVGADALRNNTTGSTNAALGRAALLENTSGSRNSAVGRYALRENTSGYDNSAVGMDALRSNSTGTLNTATGSESLRYNTTGAGNTAAGYQALRSNTSAVSNTGLGTRALFSTTTGQQNTAAGARALYSSTGARNTALGYRAGVDLTTGSDNIHVGNYGVAGETATIKIGRQGTQTATYVAGIHGSSLTGSNVVVTAAGRLGVAMGASGDADTLDGIDSSGFVQVGQAAGGDLGGTFPNPTVDDNWIDEAGDTLAGDLDMDGNNIVGLGNLQKGGNLFLHTSAVGSLGLGDRALASNTLGSFTTAMGTTALYSNVSGSRNSAFGFESLYDNSTGESNSGFGDNSLRYNTTGGQNTATGAWALRDNLTGQGNVASGNNALEHNTAGAYNTAIGRQAMRNHTAGSSTGVGHRALYNNTTGSSNVALGSYAGYNATTGSNNIFISNQGSAGDAGKIKIGVQGTQTATYVAGIHGSALAGSNVVVTAAGRLGVAAGASGDADTLDGIDSLAFIEETELDTIGELEAQLTDAANVIVSTEIDSEADLEALLLDVADVLTNNDSVDADTLDGVDSAGFVLKAGDTMTGTLTLTPGAGPALVANDDVNLVGANVLKGGASFLHDDGTQNLGVGLSALANNTTGSGNTASGFQALIANTTGVSNTATGFYALHSNTVGLRNTAIGSRALDSNESSSNTAVGASALRLNTSGERNTATGLDAMRLNTTGNRNVAIGYRAGRSLTTGDDNIVISNEGAAGDAAKIKIGVQGTQTATYVAGIHGTALAGSSVVVTAAGQLGVAAGASGDADTLDGIDSLAFIEETELDTEAELESQLTDAANVIVSTEIDTEAELEALLGDVTDVLTDNDSVDADTLDGIDSTGFLQAVPNHGFATRNTRIGQDALASNTTGSDNSASGYRALNLNTSGYDNTATGANALRANTTGTNNTAHGYDALRNNVSGDFNTALGDRALQANTVDKNTALGAESLRSNTTGTGNTAAGYAALRNTSTGFDNTAMGYKALMSNTTGARNVAFGGDALRYATGEQNTAIGDDALRANTTGGQNAAVGQDVMIANTTGSHNAALGSGALFSNQSGDHNAAVGEEALRGNTTGDYNTAVGSDALFTNTSGLRNVAVGRRAGYNLTTGNDNVMIANEGAGGDAAKIKIGVQGTQTATYVAGIFGSALAGSNVVVTATGRLGVAAGASGDADTLDGIDSAAFLQKSELDSEAELEAQLVGVANVLTNNDAVDAATLDGFDSPDFVAVAGDTMTGTLTLTPGAGEALVTTAGKVGIGTAAPGKTLHVLGTGASSGAVIHHSAVGAPITSPFVSIETDVYSTTTGILSIIDRRQQTNASTTPTLRVENTHASTDGNNPLVEVEAAGSPRFLVQHDGEVGVGTASPSGGVHVVHDGAQLYLEDSGSAAERHVAQLFMDANKLRLIANHFAGAPTLGMSLESRNVGVSVEAVTIAGDGDVGIGDTTPTNKLTVAGDVSIGNETEALDNPAFVLNGNDLYVSGTAGVDGTIFTDSGLTVGASTTLADGSLTSSGDFQITPNSGSDDFLVTAANVTIGASTLEVTSVIRATPTDSPGTCDGTTEGSFYYDASQSEPCFCDGTNWKDFDSGTTCT